MYMQKVTSFCQAFKNAHKSIFFCLTVFLYYMHSKRIMKLAVQ